MLKHLACIMDGNRRWAKQHGLLPVQGHASGVLAAYGAIEFCLKNRIPFLSLYTFSLQNLNRSQQEIDFIYNLFAQEIKQKREELHKKNIRICLVGDRSKISKDLCGLLDDVVNETKDNRRLTLNLLFCYGGREEIIHGVKTVVQELVAGKKKLDSITPESFSNFLWTGNSPDPELIFRSGGDHRLSNFLTYQSVYSELYFTDKLWPDVTESDLHEAVVYFEQCKRRFGK